MQNDSISIEGQGEEYIKYFLYQHHKYIWKDDIIQFVPIKVPDESLKLNDIIDNSCGLTSEEQSRK